MTGSSANSVALTVFPLIRDAILQGIASFSAMMLDEAGFRGILVQRWTK